MSRYLPGPHVASPSTKENTTPYEPATAVTTTADPRGEVRLAVLSKTDGGSSEAVAVCDGVGDDDWLPVADTEVELDKDGL